MKTHYILLAASLLSSNAFAVHEIADTRITQDLASTVLENGEPTIRFNPEYCQALGDKVCHFFLSHEYGHIALGHPLGVSYTASEAYAADCWVAQNAPEDLAKAAYSYFSNAGKMGSWSFGSAQQRAENLATCPTTSSTDKPIGDYPPNQIQAKSSFNHYWADIVFADIEKDYASYFPYSFTFAWEYNFSGTISYQKKYYNGSALAEEKGGLYYKILGGNWKYWGPITSWRV